jgi:hypothetical protein
MSVYQPTYTDPKTGNKRKQAVSGGTRSPLLDPSANKYHPSTLRRLIKPFVLLEPPAGIEPATC